MSDFTVGIDCDGVIRNLTQGLADFVRGSDLGRAIRDDPQDPREYGVMQMFDPGVKGAGRRAARILFGDPKTGSHIFQTAPAIEPNLSQVRAGISAVRAAGGSVVVCTKQSTAWQRAATCRWLGRNDVDADAVIITRASKGIFGLDWHLDDRVRHVREVSEAGGWGVLMRRRHNERGRAAVSVSVPDAEAFFDIIIDEVLSA